MKTIKLMKSLLLAVAVMAGVNHLQAQNYYTRGEDNFYVGYNSGSLVLLHRLSSNAQVNGSDAGPFPSPVFFVPTNHLLGRIARRPTFPSPVFFVPTNLVIVVTNITIARPSDSQWDFLGNNPGDPCWYAPQTQDTNRVWLGFSAEGLTYGDWDDDLQITLLDVDSLSGDVSLYQTDAFGSPNVFFATSDGIGAEDSFNFPVGLQANYNWIFTDYGTYKVTIKVSGTHKTDGYKEVTDTFTFEVQP